MVEEEIEIIIAIVDRHPLLARHKAASDAHFDHERLDLAQNRGLQVFFLVGILQPKKIEEIRIAKHHIRRDHIVVSQSLQLHFGELGGFARKSGSFIQHACDLLSQGTNTPSLYAAQLRVELTLKRLLQRDQRDEMRPRQLCISDTTIFLSGNTSANCTILRRFFSAKPRPNSFSSFRPSSATTFAP